ncbi:MAG: glutathione peroxidase [Treponema sp.]|jgi:glutathione peroxidase|nr:glutathione peroxidase [Treponema sp.]
MTIYDFTVKDIKGQDISLNSFKGKILLIVNTATGCGLTPQYTGLQKLYEDYQAKGFEILDFPCNQFANQTPGTENEINSFCTLKYNTTFPRFSKIEVNGKNESPLYRFLKERQKGVLGSKNIKWNFTKFLIDKEGNVIKRYGPDKKPETIEADIKKLL